MFIGLVVLTIIAGCSSSVNQSNDANAFLSQIYGNYHELVNHKYEIAIVKRTVDGDTFETDAGLKVRLIGVNSPESTRKVEFFGKEASHYSRDRLTGKKVYMFQDAGDKDKYGRLLRYVFIENDSVMFNEALLIEGYANTMTVPPNVLFSKKFVELEREAREKNKGLWGKSDENISNPDKCAEPQIKGNINSKKEKIYHVPGGRSYERTIAEEMFCTEEEAVAAGYRKAKN
ncbi:thermonuclease family protein [Paenibacillus thermotolerans]|uniref:thermonuclease family protein n=1 Tax=Paenibacillus thermotolerans TaxID=3027807 RepID=UPI002368E3E2|nr:MULTISPECIES: thermonuclease family protein [unclassified Paenibacillus]